ncbi:hypothetical protein ABZ897_28675 [Nonomuraea sp. NPDC046802]|uniref:hypothetical protein n=1 Tax=Nonomuraea sp. NPDC046802 TaxID=3154919 RepID=UPI0033F176C5
MSTRLLDFTRAETPWARRLWDVGTFLALEELYEAGVWMDRRVLHPSAVEWQRKAMERILGDDPGFGGRSFRKEMQDLLRSPLTLVCDSRRKLRQHIDLGRPGYLGRWETCVAVAEPPRPERAARAVAAHLLDSGHSLSGLQR